ncbi:uncharacterized protein LOC108243513 isoform X2 [Kryptolebias marmoratus]|uniref:uncharacterized protein LOC108243513 isoform X2 n=1 Tax=Kryptolebias marmoratus TaxID=37003 RepID=UPI0007F901B6|nr:uncharacterized protein LOC108243513 isoform X2 [Kryptolebias marmoratus]
MRISVFFTILFFWAAQDFVISANAKTLVEHLHVELGSSHTLRCNYSCSSGFIRGCWSKTPNTPGCLGTISNGSVCTVSLNLSHVSAEDVKKNYTCYTEATDDPNLPKNPVRIVFLQVQAHKNVPNWTVTPKIGPKNASLVDKPGDSSGGEFTGIKVLAAVTVTVALVLAALAVYLCVNRNRQYWNGDPVASRSSSPQPNNAALLPIKGTLSAQNEKVSLRIPQPDNESETEVPYADIMITVRGVSTPELTQVGYLGTGEWRGDDSRSYLQASRSADRLHVLQPREVSRKMSTNSEYAVITYA